MAVDFGILAQVPTIGRSFMAGQEAAQAEQERNMLRQQQAEQMQFQRENMLAQREQRQAQAAALADAAARRNALAAYVRGGMPQGAAGLVEFGKEGFEAAEALRKEQADVLERERKTLEFVTQRLAAATPETYGITLTGIRRVSPEFAAALPQQYDPNVIGSLVRQGLDLKSQLDRTLTTQDLGGTTQIVATPRYGAGPAQVVPGSVATKTLAPGESQRLEVSLQQLQNDAARIKLEGQRLGLEGRRVAVLEENARRDADPAFQQRIEAARTVGRKAAEGDVAAVQALPRVISRAEEGVRLIDELIGKRDDKGQLLKGSRPHPGFQNAVGATWLPGIRFVPGTDAASFMSRFDQIKGASFLEAFESLKGGGAITEKEGVKATDAINRMSISTDEKEFIRAALDLQDVIRKGVANAQSRAGRTGATAPAAVSAGGVRFLGFE